MCVHLVARSRCRVDATAFRRRMIDTATTAMGALLFLYSVPDCIPIEWNVRQFRTCELAGVCLRRGWVLMCGLCRQYRYLITDFLLSFEQLQVTKCDLLHRVLQQDANNYTGLSWSRESSLYVCFLNLLPAATEICPHRRSPSSWFKGNFLSRSLNSTVLNMSQILWRANLVLWVLPNKGRLPRQLLMPTTSHKWDSHPPCRDCECSGIMMDIHPDDLYFAGILRCRVVR